MRSKSLGPVHHTIPDGVHLEVIPKRRLVEFIAALPKKVTSKILRRQLPLDANENYVESYFTLGTFIIIQKFAIRTELFYGRRYTMSTPD